MPRSLGSVLCLLALLAILRFTNGTNQCLSQLEEVTPKRVVQWNMKSLDITFELSNRVTQRLVSRIMRIFLIEVLGYPRVSFIYKDDEFDAESVFLRVSAQSNIDQRSIIPETMINMEVWIPGQMDTTKYSEIFPAKECGKVGPGGYFGWFVPRQLWQSNMTETWRMFAIKDAVRGFNPDENILKLIKNHTLIPNSINNEYYCSEKFCNEGIYIPEQCRGDSTPCAMLLTSDFEVTKFVKSDIDELNLFVKIAWVGPALKKLTKTIIDTYKYSNPFNKSLVILHWTPSDVVPNAEKDFIPISFPRCRISKGDCKYGEHRFVKVVWSNLQDVAAVAYKAIKKTTFTEEMYEDLIHRYNNRLDNMTEDGLACEWMRDNLEDVLKWKPVGNYKKVLKIGGIFPMTGESYKAKSILAAVRMAENVINRNKTVLRDYTLEVEANDGKCTAEGVMKSFIDYILHSQNEFLIGILGPACSETIEPLIGVSKQYYTMVISYGAEGSSFTDREKYPYFFRTIGENNYYQNVYFSIFKSMNWKRVAALTEDGQKYTEYISKMQLFLGSNGIALVDNAKYPRYSNNETIFTFLENFKKKKAKIIIADVDDRMARQVMCHAYNLKMTAYEGYVWFLPLWLLPNWWDTEYYNKTNGESVSCSTSQMIKAVNGYLGISHANYATDDSIMQENKTVREWRNRYENECRTQNLAPSDYAGYAYDATWTYAYAVDKLLAENESYVFSLQTPETVNRLTDIISQTDFHGVSGRIKFINGASRISTVEIIQHIDNGTKKIGTFTPNVTHNEIGGGNLFINMSAIVWLNPNGDVPDDGSEPEVKCVFSGLAELLDVTCEVAIIVVNIIVFGFIGILLIVGFILLKRRYDEKVLLHEKYMESLGIDLLQTDTSGLDKWEIPRERVVINRKLGEGAFGTVYGGEAFFTDRGWLAVAVKTLKVGSSTEEKLDFLSEVEVMKRFDHKNIIRLLGVCIKCEPVYTVMEFMLYGDLKTYLLARRHLVNDRNYEDYDEISSKKLTAMALDVARALSYLAELKYVHRDIASRNCLVNAQRTVKLGDFGMTRPMYENDYYKFNRKGMLPVRWMAPESLGLGIFTSASDVWSYGVLLYEIITFGSFPFQGLSNNEVLEHVKSGNTITIPSGLKIPLENLIRSCWTIDYKSRPHAPEIVEFLATNPRIISPCLDVPLASVQLEHTGNQIEMQLPEKFRKYSVSLPKLNQQRKDTTLVGIEDVPSDKDSFITARRSYDSSGPSAASGDCSRPLLLQSENDAKSKYVRLIQKDNNNSKNSNEISARYVNIQPGSNAVNDVVVSNDNRNITANDNSTPNENRGDSNNEINQISLLL